MPGKDYCLLQEDIHLWKAEEEGFGHELDTYRAKEFVLKYMCTYIHGI